MRHINIALILIINSLFLLCISALYGYAGYRLIIFFKKKYIAKYRAKNVLHEFVCHIGNIAIIVSFAIAQIVSFYVVDHVNSVPTGIFLVFIVFLIYCDFSQSIFNYRRSTGCVCKFLITYLFTVGEYIILNYIFKL